MHTSNLYRVPQAEKLAARLVEATFADSVFFCNSGAEANEGLVKAIRRANYENGHPERYRVICFDGAFHGRTLAMLAATGNAKYLKGFGPVVDGFDHVPFGNMNAFRDAITAETAGVLIEPVQGEGGMRPASLQYLRESTCGLVTSSASCWVWTRSSRAWGAPASCSRMSGRGSRRM